MIAIAQYSRDRGVIPDAIKQVSDVINCWGKTSENRSAYEALIGWVGADLVDRLVRLLLAQRGYDEELLEAALEGEPPDGWSLADLDAELERTRKGK